MSFGIRRVIHVSTEVSARRSDVKTPDLSLIVRHVFERVAISLLASLRSTAKCR